MEKYEIIVHQPGYLPEMEPYVVDKEDAVNALQEELWLTHDAHDMNEAPPTVEDIDPDGVVVLYGGYLHEARPV